MPGHCDRNIAQFSHALNLGIGAHHDSAGADCGVEPDDLSLAQSLHALDRAPFAYWVNFQGALLQLGFLPALGEILDPSRYAFRIVFLIFHRQPFIGKEALLDGDHPGTVMRIAVTLEPNFLRHTDPPRPYLLKSRSTLCKKCQNKEAMLDIVMLISLLVTLG